MTLEEINYALRETTTRLNDHIEQCARDKIELKARIDGAYGKLWTAAATAIALLLTGLTAAIGLLIKHMLDTHG